MQAEMTTLDAKKAGTVELSDAVFGLEPRADILQRMVRYQLAKRRERHGLGQGSLRGQPDRPQSSIGRRALARPVTAAAGANLFRGGGRRSGRSRGATPSICRKR